MLLAAAASLAALGVLLVAAGLVRRAPAGAGPVLTEVDDFDTFRASLDDSLGTRLLAAGGATAERLVRAATPSAWHERLATRIRFAGLEAALEPSVVYAAKVLGSVLALALLGAIAVLASLPPIGLVLLLLVGAAAGFVIPDVLLSSRADARQADLRRTLPEALDLMAISVQAGVGLEQAVAVVSERLPGALGEELTRYLSEMQLGFSRREALVNLRERTDCPELSTFILSLLQADALGIAIGDVLKTQATEIRAKRRQRARERAAKAPVRLLFPLVFGILPSLFVVILGPAGIQVSKNFGGP